MEQDFRAELIKSNESVNLQDSKLGKALETKGYKTANAYVLHWTPEQLENIYIVLVEGAILVRVEINKFDNTSSPTFENLSIKEYKHGLSRVNQVRLAVAEELANAKT